MKFNAKSGITVTLTSTLINEFVHFGDAIDGLDAVLDGDGNVVNGPAEGGMIKEFDEGNEAAESLYPFLPISGKKEDRLYSGIQNLFLRKFGRYFNNGKPGDKAPDKKDESLIPSKN